METLWQVRNIFLDYFLICFGGSSDCTPWPCNPPPPKARERQPLQTNTLDSLQSERPRWRLGHGERPSVHGWRGSASCYESHHQVLMEMKTVCMPYGPESPPRYLCTWPEIRSPSDVCLSAFTDNGKDRQTEVSGQRQHGIQAHCDLLLLSLIRKKHYTK